MTEIITYRLTATGIWDYEFYDTGRNLVGSVSGAVSPSAPVLITGGTIRWYSRFDIDNMIVPGTSRRVMDNQTGQEVYRLVFWQPGKYEIRTRDESLQAETRNSMYLFGKPFMPVTAMTERISEAEWLPPKKITAEPCFKTTFFENVNEAYLMMALSFPALRIY